MTRRIASRCFTFIVVMTFALLPVACDQETGEGPQSSGGPEAAGEPAPPVPSPRLAANETAAIATLRNLCVSQAHLQATGMADADSDGAGEHGSFREMTGDIEMRGREGGGRIRPPVLSKAFKNLDDKGILTRSGYLYVIYLPDAKGCGVRPDADGFESIEADLAETTYCCYAWPVTQGVTGKRTFAMNQTGDILATVTADYSGPARIPASDAAYLPAGGNDQDLAGPGSICGRIADGDEGRDGNTWAPTE